MPDHRSPPRSVPVLESAILELQNLPSELPALSMQLKERISAITPDIIDSLQELADVIAETGAVNWRLTHEEDMTQLNITEPPDQEPVTLRSVLSAVSALPDAHALLLFTRTSREQASEELGALYSLNYFVEEPQEPRMEVQVLKRDIAKALYSPKKPPPFPGGRR